MKSSFDCALSSTSRFGFVGKSVYWLVLSGTDASGVGYGLSHAWSRVRTQLGPTATAPVMMRRLFLAGPWVIRMVVLTSSDGARGFRCVESAVSVCTLVNVTS